MTVKELHEAIRLQTQAINARLVEYYEAGSTDKLVNKELSFLKEITGTSEKSQYIAMRTHRKTKAELELQLSELRYFEAWDIFTPQGQAERTQREQRAWRSYKRNHKSGITYNTWRKMVAVMGSAGSDIFNQFGGSNDTVNVVEDAVRKGKGSGEIVKAMQKVIKENKGAAKSTTDYIDDLRNALNLEL